MKSDDNADIFFLGDTYFGEWHMRLRTKKGKHDVLAEKGYLHFGRAFEALLADADEVILNLECTITDIAVSPLAKTIKTHLYKASEEGTISALKALNVSTVILANNHAVDYGKAGLVDTIQALEEAGIGYIGGGRGDAEAQRPLHFEKDCRGRRFRAAVVSTYNYGKNSEDWGFYAEGNVPGVNRQRLRSIRAQVVQEKDGHPDTIFILSPHWGPNYVWRTFTQQQQAEELVNAGVDLIVGHSAHMIQEVEYYKDRLVIYSIGNFLLNGDGEYVRRNLPPYSFIARLRVRNMDDVLEKSVLLYPVMSDNLSTDFSPRFVNEREFEHVHAILRSHNVDMAMFDRRVKIGADRFGHYFEYAVNP